MFRVTSSGPDPAIQANKKWPDVSLLAAPDTILAASDTSLELTRIDNIFHHRSASPAL